MDACIYGCTITIALMMGLALVGYLLAKHYHNNPQSGVIWGASIGVLTGFLFTGFLLLKAFTIWTLTPPRCRQKKS